MLVVDLVLHVACEFNHAFDRNYSSNLLLNLVEYHGMDDRHTVTKLEFGRDFGLLVWIGVKVLDFEHLEEEGLLEFVVCFTDSSNCIS